MIPAPEILDYSVHTKTQIFVQGSSNSNGQVVVQNQAIPDTKWDEKFSLLTKLPNQNKKVALRIKYTVNPHDKSTEDSNTVWKTWVLTATTAPHQDPLLKCQGPFQDKDLTGNK